ncbi:hypothetical protein LPJ74_000235 [Coemansia sp. RSA 1843]|nr:hypothetical protein LPJ74_000235 [Coemansia sp. RSA 1843]
MRANLTLFAWDVSLKKSQCNAMSLYTSLTVMPVRRQISLLQSTRHCIPASIPRCTLRTVAGTKGSPLLVAKREISSKEWGPKPVKQSSDKSDAKPASNNADMNLPISEDHEKVLTIPNALTMARIISSPYIGYLIIQQDYGLALAGCVVFGLTDALDGYIARKYNMRSFVGSIIDPAADKVLMTTLTLSLGYSGLMPVALAVVIIGRDVALSLAAFFIRWATLPAPKTVRRYFDLSIPSVEVRPTLVSKWNTVLQLVLMGTTLTSPVFGIPADWIGLVGLQWLTGATTIASGIGYLISKDAVHRLTKAEVAKRIPKPPSILHKKK